MLTCSRVRSAFASPHWDRAAPGVAVAGRVFHGSLESNEHRARLRGFSLLELMVVVTIIGIFVGVAVLSVNVTGTDRESEQEVFRLKSLLELVREESLLQGIDYGVLFHRDGYQFYVYDYAQRRWLKPADDRLLTDRNLAEPLGIEVVVDDRRLLLEAPPEIDDEEMEQPQVLVLATGEMTPFSFAVFRDPLGPRFTLNAEFDGEIELAQSE